MTPISDLRTPVFVRHARYLLSIGHTLSSAARALHMKSRDLDQELWRWMGRK